MTSDKIKDMTKDFLKLLDDLSEAVVGFGDIVGEDVPAEILCGQLDYMEKLTEIMTAYPPLLKIVSVGR